MSTATDQNDVTGTLVERLGLKTIVESCLVLEDGIASPKDIEIGMMAGAGILPGPFSRADEQGLDEVLAALERAEPEWGENFAPPLILRRLVNQGRLGKKSGQGFFPYPQPDSEQNGRENDRARDARRHRHLLAQPAAGEPAVAAGDQGADVAVGGGGRQAARARVRVVEHVHVLARARTSRSSRRWTARRARS